MNAVSNINYINNDDRKINALLLAEALATAASRANAIVCSTLLKKRAVHFIPIKNWGEINRKTSDSSVIYAIIKFAQRNHRQDLLCMFLGSCKADGYEEMCIMCLDKIHTLQIILKFVEQKHLPGHDTLAILYWANHGMVNKVEEFIGEGLSIKCYETVSYLLDAHDLGSKKEQFLTHLHARSSKWLDVNHAEQVLDRVSPLSF